jgi:protein O-mannosyl-transferase
MAIARVKLLGKRIEGIHLDKNEQMGLERSYKTLIFKYRVLLICIVLSATLLVVYWQVQDYDFIGYDDNVYVLNNNHVCGGFSIDNIFWALKDTHLGIWHPLTWWSHILDWALFKSNSGGHHWTSLIIHIVNTLLLFTVLNRMTGEMGKSAFVAVLFALHPLNVESVAWVAERKNVLSAFFWMLTIWFYVFYAERPGYLRYLLVLFIFSIGLMAKPMLVTLPFVLILLDYWPLGRFRLKSRDENNSKQKCESVTKYLEVRPIARLIVEKIPFFVLSLITSAITIFAAKSIDSLKPFESFPLSGRFANALIGYVTYLEKMFWPHNLSVFYPYRKTFCIGYILFSSLIVIFITIAVFRKFRKYPYLAIGWLWYMLTLFPVIGIVQVGSQSMADRYAYLPLIGLFIIIAWGVPDLFSKLPYKKSFLILLGGVCVCAITYCTWHQIQYWQNSMTLFRHALDVTENNHVAHHVLGNIMFDYGEFDKAEAHITEAVRIKPDDSRAHNDLGIVYMYMDRLDDALRHFERSVMLNPKNKKAHNNMGIVLSYRERLKEALNHFEEALTIDPDYHLAQGNRRITLQKINENKD